MDLRILLAAIMAAMALAGCVADDGDMDPEPPAVTRDGVTHLAADGRNGTTAIGGKYETGFAGTEPSIGIDSDGVVYMTGFRPVPGLVDCFEQLLALEPDPACMEVSANAGAPIAIASFDKGQTWVDLGPDVVEGTRTHRETLDPYLYVDPVTDRVYLDDLIAGYGSFMSWTDDQGATWFSHVPPAGNPHVNDHQTIGSGVPRFAGTGTEHPTNLYMCFNQVAYAACTTSYDGGLTWTPQVVVQESVQSDNPFDAQCSGMTGHVKTSPDGIVYLPSVECPTGSGGFTGSQPSEPIVYISTDDGLTWKKSVISDSVLSFPGDHETSIAVDEEGNVYALWIGADSFVYLAHSTDTGFGWSEPRRVSPPSITAATLPTIAAGSEGRVAFSYAGTTAEGGNDNPNATRSGATDDEPNGLTWNAYLGFTIDALADDLEVETVAINDPATDPIVRGNCSLTRCPGTFDFHDLWIDMDGRPWTSWIDACNGPCNTMENRSNQGNVGFAGTLREGPSLRGDGMLEPLSVQARPEDA